MPVSAAHSDDYANDELYLSDSEASSLTVTVQRTSSSYSTSKFHETANMERAWRASHMLAYCFRWMAATRPLKVEYAWLMDTFEWWVTLALITYDDGCCWRRTYTGSISLGKLLLSTGHATWSLSKHVLVGNEIIKIILNWCHAWSASSAVNGLQLSTNTNDVIILLHIYVAWFYVAKNRGILHLFTFTQGTQRNGVVWLRVAYHRVSSFKSRISSFESKKSSFEFKNSSLDIYIYIKQIYSWVKTNGKHAVDLGL